MFFGRCSVKNIKGIVSLHKMQFSHRWIGSPVIYTHSRGIYGHCWFTCVLVLVKRKSFISCDHNNTSMWSQNSYLLETMLFSRLFKKEAVVHMVVWKKERENDLVQWSSVRWNTSQELLLYLLEDCGRHLWYRALAPISWGSRSVVLEKLAPYLSPLILCCCTVAFVDVRVVQNAASENCLSKQMLYSSWCIVVGLGWPMRYKRWRSFLWRYEICD